MSPVNSTMPAVLSVVIPTLNEESCIAALLADVAALRVRHEVVVVDGGSEDATVALARRAGARVLRAGHGRGGQLRAGARAARGEILCFLHADVRLEAAARGELERLVRAREPGAHAFRLSIAAPGIAYRMVEAGANLRSRYAQLPYGDQGLVVYRRDYLAAGGYPPLPLMEDVALARRLRRITRIHLLPVSIRVSGRRWQRRGVARSTLRNLMLLAAYFAGISPGRLATFYEARPGGG